MIDSDMGFLDGILFCVWSFLMLVIGFKLGSDDK